MQRYSDVPERSQTQVQVAELQQELQQFAHQCQTMYHRLTNAENIKSIPIASMVSFSFLYSLLKIFFFHLVISLILTFYKVFIRLVKFLMEKINSNLAIYNKKFLFNLKLYNFSFQQNYDLLAENEKLRAKVAEVTEMNKKWQMYNQQREAYMKKLCSLGSGVGQCRTQEGVKTSQNTNVS